MTSTQRATYWGPNTQFAIKSFPEQRALAEQRGWKVDGQEEQCETTGRRHIQFWVKTPQVRMSEVKKIFSGAHIEVARNVKAVQQYCQKEETRSGSLPQASDKYPTQDKLFALFSGWLHAVVTLRKGAVLPRTGEEWLQRFDECCEKLIIGGMRVESLAVNPAVRSAIKKYGSALYSRHISEKFEAEDGKHPVDDRQTDRQPEFFSETVTIPTIDAYRRDENSATPTQSDPPSGDESQDFEDGECSASEGHDESPDDDDCEASDGTCDSE